MELQEEEDGRDAVEPVLAMDIEEEDEEVDEVARGGAVSPLHSRDPTASHC